MIQTKHKRRWRRPERSEDGALGALLRQRLEGVGKVLTARHLLSAVPEVARLPHDVSESRMQLRQRSLPRLRAPSAEVRSIRVIADGR